MHSAKNALRIRPARQAELLAWYARQPLETRLRVHGEKLRLFRAWRGRQKDGEDVIPAEQADYAALLAGISVVEKSVSETKTPKDFAVRVEQAKLRRKARSAPAADNIEKQFLPLISSLRHEGLSWRDIAAYLKQHHRKVWSHSYIHTIYKTAHPDVA